MYGIMPYSQNVAGGDGKMREATQPTAKTARLEAPATDDQKALFQRAADLTGRALTDFVVSSAEEIATRTVHEREVLTLSGLRRKGFLDALLNSPSPSKPSACAERPARFEAGFEPVNAAPNLDCCHDDEGRETAICVTSILGSGAAEKTAEPPGIRCAGP
jgi:uncharacterized protein (DUF1778 family)